MNALNRFLKYVSFDTQSAEGQEQMPSTDKQKVLGAALAEELGALGLHNAHMDEFGYVYAWLPPPAGCEGVPCVGLIAHMDTSPEASGADVKPRIVHYDGSDVVLNMEQNIVLSPAKFPTLKRYVGQDLVVTDGTTLLGADDKAGIAEIVTAVEYLTQHPEIPHGRIAVCFTPDEEVGRGADKFDVAGFGAAVAYTVDGGALGQLEYENFNAASAKITIHGVNIHPGEAKNKMKNAVLIANELISLLPADETPGTTEGYEGFYHVNSIEGNVTCVDIGCIIREHDKELFLARKQRMTDLVGQMNAKYGAGYGGADAEGSILQHEGNGGAAYVSDPPGPGRHDGGGGGAGGGAGPRRHRRRSAVLHGPALPQSGDWRHQLPRRARIHPGERAGKDDGCAGKPGKIRIITRSLGQSRGTVLSFAAKKP